MLLKSSFKKKVKNTNSSNSATGAHLAPAGEVDVIMVDDFAGCSLCIATLRAPPAGKDSVAPSGSLSREPK